MEEPVLKELHFDENGIAFSMQGITALAEMLSNWFESTGARNFATIEISHPKLGPLEMTMQRKWKQTPSQLASKYREVLEKIATGHRLAKGLAVMALKDPEYDP